MANTGRTLNIGTGTKGAKCHSMMYVVVGLFLSCYCFLMIGGSPRLEGLVHLSSSRASTFWLDRSRLRCLVVVATAALSLPRLTMDGARWCDRRGHRLRCRLLDIYLSFDEKLAIGLVAVAV